MEIWGGNQKFVKNLEILEKIGMFGKNLENNLGGKIGSLKKLEIWEKMEALEKNLKKTCKFGEKKYKLIIVIRFNISKLLPSYTTKVCQLPIYKY